MFEGCQATSHQAVAFPLQENCNMWRRVLNNSTIGKVSKCRSSGCPYKNHQQLTNSSCLQCTVLNLLQIEGLRYYRMSKLGFEPPYILTVNPATYRKKP